MDAPILRIDRHSLPGPHILPAATQVSLEITRGRVRQRVRLVRGRVFLIGAATDCDLVLGDLQFPEAYAYLFVNGSQVTIRRLGSGPELFVCGQAAQQAELFHGDLVAFGPFELLVRIDDARPRGRGGIRQGEETGDQPDNESAEAADEVQTLLADIRRALSAQSPLALYDGSLEDETWRIPQRASA
jgi:pSer/pThr/pTyr-binding forkhead associated (FHA) protein